MVIFHRETHSGGGNAGRVAARNKADLRVVFALIKRGNRPLYRRPSL